MTPNLDAYFARIGFSGAREPTLQVLSTLHRLHPAAIPFENLDPFLERPVRIDPAAVEAKLVGTQRGGYCFEHNSLFSGVLNELGFRVAPLAARVILRWHEGQPRPALTHRLTLVELAEGFFIADVGFGGQSPTAPLKLEHGQEQYTSHGTYRILQSDQTYELQWGLEGAWSGMYRFTLESHGPADFEMSNWFTSAHPSSHFRQNLLASKVDGERRVNLLNTRVTTRYKNTSEEQVLTCADDLDRLLRASFGIDPPAPIETLWERVPKT